jgi:hypothetical protein
MSVAAYRQLTSLFFPPSRVYKVGHDQERADVFELRRPLWSRDSHHFDVLLKGFPAD